MRDKKQLAKDRTAVLRLLERSGQSVAEFCREQGLLYGVVSRGRVDELRSQLAWCGASHFSVVVASRGIVELGAATFTLRAGNGARRGASRGDPAKLAALGLGHLVRSLLDASLASLWGGDVLFVWRAI
jgi:hypothetical protein